MAAIQFKNGITWDTIPTAATRQLVDQDDLISKLAQLRADWAEATGGDITSVTLDLGMLFDDVINLCGGYKPIGESSCIRRNGARITPKGAAVSGKV